MKRFKRILLFFILSVSLLLIGLHISSEVIIWRITANAEDSELNNVQRVTVNSVEWAYREYNPSGQETIVFIHGFMGSSFDFHHFNMSLIETIDYHIIAVDLPGFGFSEKSTDYHYTSANHATQLTDLMTELNISEYHLVGHSMGGDIAKRHAVMNSDAVLSLTLLSAAGLDPSSEARVLPKWFYNVVFTNYFAQRWGVNTATTINLTNSQFHPYIIQNAQIPAEILQKFSQDQDTEGTLILIKNLQMPTLIIYGKEDSWTPYTLGVSLNNVLSDSELHVVEGLGHLPYLENPEVILGVFISFLINLG